VYDRGDLVNADRVAAEDEVRAEMGYRATPGTGTPSTIGSKPRALDQNACTSYVEQVLVPFPGHGPVQLIILDNPRGRTRALARCLVETVEGQVHWHFSGHAIRPAVTRFSRPRHRGLGVLTSQIMNGRRSGASTALTNGHYFWRAVAHVSCRSPNGTLAAGAAY
jgi:hypothetical protein